MTKRNNNKQTVNGLSTSRGDSSNLGHSITIDDNSAISSQPYGASSFNRKSQHEENRYQNQPLNNVQNGGQYYNSTDERGYFDPLIQNKNDNFYSNPNSGNPLDNNIGFNRSKPVNFPNLQYQNQNQQTVLNRNSGNGNIDFSYQSLNSGVRGQNIQSQQPNYQNFLSQQQPTYQNFSSQQQPNYQNFLSQQQQQPNKYSSYNNANSTQQNFQRNQNNFNSEPVSTRSTSIADGMRARAQLNTINQTNPVETVNYQNSPYFVDQNNRRNQRNHQQPIPNDRYPSGDNQQRNRFENAYSSSNILNENILNPNPPSTNDISASQMSRVNIDGTSGIN